MLSLVVLFAVALVPITEIYGEPALNLDDLLNALETQQKKDQNSRNDRSASSDTSDTSGSDDDKDVALRGGKLVRFLQQARDKQNYKKLTENKRLSKLYTQLTNAKDVGSNKYLAKNKDLGADYVDVDVNRNNQVDNFVEYLLSQSNKKSYTKAKTPRPKNRDDYLLTLNKKQLKEDKLTKLSDQDDVTVDDNLQDYSRIYVILNPEALKSSQNKKDLSALVSRLMSKSSSVKQSRMSPKQLQYKGFPVREVYAERRFKRDSLESGRDSTEDRPRRPRHNNYYGGDGGGGGGRTPIPYIRHRGDIYERDE